MMMPAPTPEEIFTKTEVSWPRADAVPVLGERAEVGVVLHVHGHTERCSATARVLTSSQPGKMAEDRMTLSVTGAGSPRPTWRRGPCTRAIASSIAPAMARASAWRWRR